MADTTNGATNKGPGYAAAVVEIGALQHVEYNGVADLESMRPIDSETIFDVGSVSKQFTGFAVAMLADQGAIELDRSIGDYLSPLTGTSSTVRQLLEHEGEFLDYTHWYFFGGAPSHAEMPTGQLMEHLAGGRMRSGARTNGFLYSNTGYDLLARLVYQVTGLTLRQYAQRYMFEPLGMGRTLFRDDINEVISNRALAYDTDGNDLATENEADFVGPGGLNSCLSDLALWEQNRNHNRLGDDPERLAHLLFGETATTARPCLYRFGLRHLWLNGGVIETHLGSSAGFGAFMLRDPIRERAVYVLSNGQAVDFGALGRRLSGDMLPVQGRATDPAADRLYINRETGLARRFDGEGRALLGTRAVEVQQVGAGPAHCVGDSGLYQFRLDDGSIREICLGPSYDRVLVPTAEWHPSHLEVYTGSYHSEAMDVTYEIFVQDGVLSLKTAIPHTYALTPTDTDSFDHPSIAVRFQRDDHDHVTGMLFGTDRLASVEFVREGVTS